MEKYLLEVAMVITIVSVAPALLEASKSLGLDKYLRSLIENFKKSDKVLMSGSPEMRTPHIKASNMLDNIGLLEEVSFEKNVTYLLINGNNRADYLRLVKDSNNTLESCETATTYKMSDIMDMINARLYKIVKPN